MESVLGQICEKMEYEKRVEKIVGKGHAVNEVCGRGGGQRRGGRLRLASLQGALHYYSARPATSERGAADLSRLRRVPAAEIETKSCGCDTKMHDF